MTVVYTYQLQLLVYTELILCLHPSMHASVSLHVRVCVCTCVCMHLHLSVVQGHAPQDFFISLRFQSEVKLYPAIILITYIMCASIHECVCVSAETQTHSWMDAHII